MTRWRIEYWTYENDDGDPDELEMLSEHEPKLEDIEAALMIGVRSFRAHPMD